METDVSDAMIVKNGVKGLNGMESPKTVLLGEDEREEEEDMESYSLLAPKVVGAGGMARNGEKRRLSVQWNDQNGQKLAEVLEFQPSDASDSEEDEDACMCCIM